jgi:SET domain-containing protein
LFTKNSIYSNTKIIEAADLKRYKQGKFFISKLGRLINHKKDANCILKKEGEIFYLFSNRNILEHEELTCDYSLLSSPFKSDISKYDN